MEKVDKIKALLAAGVAILTALWGWFGWLVMAWVACMFLDYVTGSAVALKAGEWSSTEARDGLWRKVGTIVAVLVSGILDLVLGHLLQGLPDLPFTYTVLLCPLVVVWYILTEAGSVVENAGALGAPLPRWLRKAIAVLKDKLDESQDNNPSDIKE